MKYKVGDKVRIIEKDDMDLYSFVKGGTHHLKPHIEEYLNKRDRLVEILEINDCHVTFDKWTIFKSLIQSSSDSYMKENYINNRFEILDL